MEDCGKIILFILLVLVIIIYFRKFSLKDLNDDPILGLEIMQNGPLPNIILKRIIRIGHRGAAGYVEENTLESFEKALEMGVDVIEFDVHQTLDGRFVVIHDKDTKRTTNGTGLVVNKTMFEISQLRTKNDNKIPSLEEVLDFIETRVVVNIEIKSVHHNGVYYLSQLIDYYIQNKGWTGDCFVVSSFDHYLIKEFKNYQPDVHTSALLEGIPIDLANFGTKANANSISVSKDYVNKNLVIDAHRRKLLVFVYTANTEDEIFRLIEIGVDGIFSDYPNLTPRVVGVNKD